MSKARDIVEALRTAVLDADIGTTVQAFNAAIMVDGDIGTTVQAHDADTAKLDANANFTGTLQRGGTDVLVTGDVTNANFTGADLEIAKGGTGASSAGAARTALGVVIGTDVLAPDGSAANLTNLPAGGAEDFVASGTLPNGKPVILKANGQVEVVEETVVATTIPSGGEQVFHAANTISTKIAFDPNTAGKFVITYGNGAGSSYGTAVVGTISGTTLSFGTPVVFISVYVMEHTLQFDPNTANKFVVCYNNSGGATKVGTVSGTSISFGSEANFNSWNAMQAPCISFDPNTANKFVVTFANPSNGGAGTAIIGTISGTTVSWGSRYVFNTGTTTNHTTASYDLNTANKFVVAYRDGSNSNYGSATVGTVSGTAISFGTEAVYQSEAITEGSIGYVPDTADKFVIAFKNATTSTGGQAKVGTVSGTSITFGSGAVFNAGRSPYVSMSFDPNAPSKFIVGYQDDSDSSYGKVAVGTVSGTSIAFSSEYTFNTGTTTEVSSSFDPNTAGKFIVAYRDQGNSNQGTAIVGVVGSTTPNLTATNFLGTATAAYTNGQTASIMLKGGISDNQTSLTAGSTYYVQTNGTFATSAGTPSVLAGKAVSATSLLLNGLDEIPSQSGNTGKFLTTNGSAASWGNAASAMTVVAPVATTSGSAIDFTGIPSGTKQIIVSFWNVSTNAADPRYRIQLGDAGGIETSGYTTCAMRLTDGANLSAYVTGDGIALMRYATASEYVFGQVILQLQDSSDNTWVSNGNLRIHNQSLYVSAGAKTLSAELDKVRVICHSGQTFDFGEIGLAYI